MLPIKLTTSFRVLNESVGTPDLTLSSTNWPSDLRSNSFCDLSDGPPTLYRHATKSVKTEPLYANKRSIVWAFVFCIDSLRMRRTGFRTGDVTSINGFTIAFAVLHLVTLARWRPPMAAICITDRRSRDNRQSRGK